MLLAAVVFFVCCLSLSKGSCPTGWMPILALPAEGEPFQGTIFGRCISIFIVSNKFIQILIMAVLLTLRTITSFGTIFIFVLLGVSGSIDSTSKSPGSGNVSDLVHSNC